MLQGLTTCIDTSKPYKAPMDRFNPFFFLLDLMLTMPFLSSGTNYNSSKHRMPSNLAFHTPFF